MTFYWFLESVKILDKDICTQLYVKFWTSPTLRYRSYKYDNETSFYYLQTRYYNPEIARFISSDGLLGEVGNIQSTNMYAYCANNPVAYFDPKGEFYLEALTFSVVLITIFTIYSTASRLHDCFEEPFVVDISYSHGYGINIKGGISIVFNLEEKYIEFYPHIGLSIGVPGFSASIGTLDNYNRKGDYKKLFLYGEFGYFIGLNHCFDPWQQHSETVQATSLMVGNRFLSFGGDYYFHLDFLTIDWS